MEHIRGVLVMNWCFGIGIFGVDNSLSSHADNCKDDDINGSVGTVEKTFSINFRM